MALGANCGIVVVLVLRGALALIVIGLLRGLPLTVAAGRLLRSQIYGMNPLSATLAAVLFLGLSALIASLVPSRVANKFDFAIGGTVLRVDSRRDSPLSDNPWQTTFGELAPDGELILTSTLRR